MTPSTNNSKVSEQAHPTEISCREIFDRAMACQSPFGQIQNVYRHGSLRSCAVQWSDFLFCWRVKTISETSTSASTLNRRDNSSEVTYDPLSTDPQMSPTLTPTATATTIPPEKLLDDSLTPAKQTVRDHYILREYQRYNAPGKLSSDLIWQERSTTDRLCTNF